MKQQILGVIAKAALVASLALAWAASADAQKFSDWSAPVNLGSTINSAANDQHPTLSKDGLTLIFASDRTGSFGDIDLWVSQRESLDSDWQAPQNLTMLIRPFVISLRTSLPMATGSSSTATARDRPPAGARTCGPHIVRTSVMTSAGSRPSTWAAHSTQLPMMPDRLSLRTTLPARSTSTSRAT